MDQDMRLEASHLVDLLTANDSHFDVGMVRRLIDLIPVSQRRSFLGISEFRFNALHNIRRSTQGHAAGVGDVELEEDDRSEIEFSIGGRKIWRCGLYKISHQPGEIVASQLFADTMEDDGANRSIRILYDPQTGNPEVLQLYSPKVYSFGIVRFTIAAWDDWKRPTLAMAG